MLGNSKEPSLFPRHKPLRLGKTEARDETRHLQLYICCSKQHRRVQSSDQSPAIFDARGQIKRPAVHNRGKCCERGFFVRAEVSLQHCTVMLLEGIRCSEVSVMFILIYQYIWVNSLGTFRAICVYTFLWNVPSVKYLRTVFSVGNRVDLVSFSQTTLVYAEFISTYGTHLPRTDGDYHLENAWKDVTGNYT